jgi:hypothetical protein
MTASPVGRRTGPFIATKEHRRFTEFANAIRKHRTIGLCFGPAGVGKTLSARRHANWELAEPLLQTWGPREPSDEKVYAALARSRTVFHTPTVGGTLRELRKDLDLMTSRVDICIKQDRSTTSDGKRVVSRASKHPCGRDCKNVSGSVNSPLPSDRDPCYRLERPDDPN